MPHVNKKNRSLTEFFFSHLNFSLSRKQRYEQKTTLFSLHSSFCSATKSLQIFSRVSFPTSKLIKNGLLQYSSSSRNKKTEQYNLNSLNCKKNQEHSNIARLSLQLRSFNKDHVFQFRSPCELSDNVMLMHNGVKSATNERTFHQINSFVEVRETKNCGKPKKTNFIISNWEVPPVTIWLLDMMETGD